MLVDEMPHIKKNNHNYSHCPLKKRPFYYTSEDGEETETSEVKEEIIDVGVDDIPEPENLSTKPEDLSRTAADRHQQKQEEQEECASRTPPPIIKVLPSPPLTIQSSPPPHHPIHHVHALHHYHHYPTKTITPPAGIAPIPVAKKARVEVIQHNDNSTTPTAGMTATSAPLHFMASKAPLEPLNLNTPVEPLAHYATPAWSRPPIYPSHYLSYPAPAYHRYPAELYSYPVATYPHSSPEHHPSVSPPPHTALTCPTIQRPIARPYSHWSTSPDHCGLSPTSSVGSGSLRSPPPVTPEDLSSPGSDSGRSSAGSTSAGHTLVNTKMEKSGSNASPGTSSSTTASRYSCPDCNKSYSTYSGLSKHQQYHCSAAQGQAKKSFSCKFCQKVYVSLGALKMHIRTHTLPCKCHTCGKAFSRPWLLQGHIRTHTGEKPFRCQHCNRAFADRSNLRAHLQTHSDVKKYSCDRCSKTFSRMSLLTKHQEGGCPGVPVSVGYPC
ncbi:zinc finger protein SNAI2-like [Pseudomyrmex gracilis]|uniref:zinc finger protein SNAI2-like n=1 Tax=Pseudomyrmex gracilis TaxID=219809 RepID=UPI0009954D85|nr:zinc finger protein SNAI2-like [Pseudomyrmex gracilis]